MSDAAVTGWLVALAAVVGSLVGSFANVVIHRLPRGASIVFPGSHCPKCQRRLGPLDLVPVLSWLALRGRCRGCSQPISPRYPLVELLFALLFGLVVLRWPGLEHAGGTLLLLVVLSMLTMAALIDVDHYVLPDSLTLPAVPLVLLAAYLARGAQMLPGPTDALVGVLVGAGVLVLINRIGALVLRRFADTEERLWPLSLDQVNIAALAGVIGGEWVGLAAGIASVLLNLVTRKTVRAPEQLIYALWLAALVLSFSSFTLPTYDAFAGSVMAAGFWALAGAVYWWIHDLVKGAAKPLVADAAASPVAVSAHGAGGAVGVSTAQAALPAARTSPTAGDDEPVAMGFGDVKLAAVIGGFLGWENLLVALFLAVFVGAVGGLAGRLLFGGKRAIPFGPYLLAGGLLALFFGDSIVAWYLALLMPA